jgi:hypothetical protein
MFFSFNEVDTIDKSLPFYLIKGRVLEHEWEKRST